MIDFTEQERRVLRDFIEGYWSKFSAVCFKHGMTDVEMEAIFEKVNT